MSDQYDVIVVGAGNGGLTAACTTAKNGLRTLLLEKHNLPGGCATSFVRGRFEFDASLQELRGMGFPGEKDYVYTILKELGVDIGWRYAKSAFRAAASGKNGYDVTVGSGIEDFCSSINKAVPGCGKKVRNLFKLAEQNIKAQAYLSKAKGSPNRLVLSLKYGNFMKCSSHSVEDIEKALGIPEKARNIINTLWTYLGVPTDELNCTHFLNLLSEYVRYGSVLPAKRSHEISEALLNSFTGSGGEVLFNHEVTHFITDQKERVIGVEAGGCRFYAKHVISDLMPDCVFKMMNRSAIPDGDLKLANARKTGLSAETVYLGMDCTMEELGIKNYTTFILSDPNPRNQQKENGVITMNCLNRIIPDCSPAGTCIIVLTRYCFGKELPADLSPENYRKYKNKTAEKIIEQAEILLKKKLRSNIEEIEIATPVTFARYLNTPAGAIYGYELSGWDNLMNRMAHEAKEYTVPGLSFAGGHHFRGPGVGSSYYTGYFEGNRVVRKMRNEALAILKEKVKK